MRNNFTAIPCENKNKNQRICNKFVAVTFGIMIQTIQVSLKLILH